jgi:hypothetical protein
MEREEKGYMWRRPLIKVLEYAFSPSRGITCLHFRRSGDDYSFFKHFFLLIEPNLSFICWTIILEYLFPVDCVFTNVL